ncbi:hypothetical protein ACOACQ_21645 [Nocardioides sp. CPCC 206347]
MARALRLYQQQLSAERDAQLLESLGDYDDFDELVSHVAVGD